MSLTPAEIEEIVRAAGCNSAKRSSRSRDLCEMLARLEDYSFGPRRAPPLTMLCRAGVDHAWGELERKTKPELLLQLSPRARESVKRHLQTTLERITRPSYDLEWSSFTLALGALGFPGPETAPLSIQMFLHEKPSYRLGRLFRSFPALAHLWVLAMTQWHTHVVEILLRFRKDRVALAKTFLKENIPNRISDLRLGLSDSHHGSRSVALIEFSRDKRVIYKPRSGRNELAWFAVLEWMNRNGFQPKHRLLQVLVRKGYCWMEYAEAAPCSGPRAVRRFYERLGGLIATAYLLKAVDCHRENLIAAGEHPVLVDVDALWHVSAVTKTQSVGDVLYRTGFFPNARRSSLQSRSSVLGRTSRGSHLPRLGSRVQPPGRYAKEIISGFVLAWQCALGKPSRRTAFRRTLERIRVGQRRWIYLATAKYAAILRASFRPSILSSIAERDALITKMSSRASVSRRVARAEAEALQNLSIPYFNRRSREGMPLEPHRPPAELIRAIQVALQWTEP